MAVANLAESTASKKGAEKGVGGVERSTPELVIGLVGAVGAGVSTTAQELSDMLVTDYGYDKVTIVKISEIIRSNGEKVDKYPISKSGSDRIRELQEVGTLLREKFGDEYLAAKAIEDIGISRDQHGGYEPTQGPSVAKPIRRATIIDSLKHQDESRLLRETYGGVYWQFTVFAPESVRETRLKAIGVERQELAGIFDRDENDQGGDHGQKVSKTAHLSDFFVRNDQENKDRLKTVLSRFLEIMFGVSIHTPNLNESGMYAAISAASRSACLSRQVGAAIYSRDGELLSIGCNDVPKFGGGLYTDDDGSSDNRCFKWRDCTCHNDMRKESLYQEIFQTLSKEAEDSGFPDGLLREGVKLEDVRRAITETAVKSLIEFSRSIHAEMEAIVSTARAGKAGLVGAKLYTTTFPCHNCARHIVAAGINEVYYIEPYSKSLAIDLHGDAISLTEDTTKVCFLQYEGVGPSVSMKLFQAHGERKSGGKALTYDKKVALPVLPPPLDGFTTHEKRVITKIKELEEA